MKRYEFWHPRLFEAPFYAYLGLQCLINRIGIRSLAKANFALNHGEIGIGSKYESHRVFDEKHFLPMAFIPEQWSHSEKSTLIQNFAAQHDYPVIVKSNLGCVGKGIRKISSAAEAQATVAQLAGDYMVQKFTPHNTEYGVFYSRHQGQPRITGINRKHFPSVTGNGLDTVGRLARQHERHNQHWAAFLHYSDTDRIPATGEVVQLSFIGSHTLGCKFTDETHQLTPALQAAIFALFEQQPGYNFGRLDVKAQSPEAFARGEFDLIEVNGVASLPTHMFDPKYSLLQAYGILFEHARLLAKIARQHRTVAMPLLPLREIIRRVGRGQATLNQAHQQLMPD